MLRALNSSRRVVLAIVLTLLLLATACAPGGCGRGPTPPPTPTGRVTPAQANEPIDNDPKALRVLFIGNSLTQSNDLPAMVRALSQAERSRSIFFRTVLRGGASLEDHWEVGGAPALIRECVPAWDVVVMQQGPSARPASRVELVASAKKYNEAIRAAKARPAFYMVWVESSRANEWDGSTASYTAAAEAVDGMLFPVGEALRIAIKRDPSIELFDTDGFHPSPTGTYLAALVIYQGLTGKTPIGLPAKLTLQGASRPVVELTEEQAKMLQECAVEANKKFGRPGK